MIGIMNLIYGGFYALMTLMMCIFFFFIGGMLSSLPPEADAPPVNFFYGIMAFVVVFNAIFSVPAVVAGYGLLKKKDWGRIAGIVSAICASLSVPFGTALCVYSLWFFFGEAGKSLPGELAGSGAQGVLPEHREAAASEWGRQGVGDERQRVYRQPPDWRG